MKLDQNTIRRTLESNNLAFQPVGDDALIVIDENMPWMLDDTLDELIAYIKRNARHPNFNYLQKHLNDTLKSVNVTIDLLKKRGGSNNEQINKNENSQH